MHFGICGYAEAGKDVVADLLVAEFGFVKVNMSDALDHYLQVLNPLIAYERDPITQGEGILEGAVVIWQFARYAELRQMMSLTEAKKIPEVRELLQRLGTDVGRAIDPLMWVKEVERLAVKHERVVTTGIRFPEEADMLDFLIYVDRLGVGPKNDHPSEQLDAIFARSDVAIPNDGTIEQLQQIVRVLAPEWIEEHS